MTFVYTWEVPRDVGPTSTDPNCLTWLYYSSVNLLSDINSGLVGPLLVCRSGSLGEDGKQKGKDKEFYLLATIFDENKSYLLDENIETFTTKPENVDKNDPDFQMSNQMYCKGTCNLQYKCIKHLFNFIKSKELQIKRDIHFSPRVG
ncbi:unnamed protein product [Gulo gulo]|uniref:Uncharacterized protein n=1 Tax=Gulo gulo TaxID=48420 RepID=A0A9X9M0X5_GULGU|nr:unnamed protein product [Gulo gulo]